MTTDQDDTPSEPFDLVGEIAQRVLDILSPRLSELETNVRLLIDEVRIVNDRLAQLERRRVAESFTPIPYRSGE